METKHRQEVATAYSKYVTLETAGSMEIEDHVDLLEKIIINLAAKKVLSTEKQTPQTFDQLFTSAFKSTVEVEDYVAEYFTAAQNLYQPFCRRINYDRLETESKKLILDRNGLEKCLTFLKQTDETRVRIFKFRANRVLFEQDLLPKLVEADVEFEIHLSMKSCRIVYVDHLSQQHSVMDNLGIVSVGPGGMLCATEDIIATIEFNDKKQVEQVMLNLKKMDKSFTYFKDTLK